MKTKKKSFYQSRIESLKRQSENESKTIKELLSPAVFEKLNKAQSALPQLASCQYKQPDFKEETLFEVHQVQLKKLEKKKPEKERKRQKLTVWERRANDIRNAEVKELLGEVLEKVDKRTELQGIFDEIERETEEFQSAFTEKHQSGSLNVKPNEVETLDGCAREELESYELWEPKVELLEVGESVALPICVEKQSELKEEPKETKELISYVSVEQLSRLVELQKEPDDSEESPFQKQFFQLCAVPVEGAYGLIEIKKEPENAEDVPFSYFPVDQQSNFYVLN